ncbi:MAG: hypothetical protein AUH39_01395 [Chloroflexi bacterium 13_1_40CM_67_9]|nr:MAG: hypothetical protein AUH39_01395 [Chloroflexi bacterium 13_1_40CM_67_9]
MTAQLSNDQTRLVPRTEFPQGRVLEFDFPGLEIGVAEYDEGPTGCTVFHLPKVASLSIDVRGGSPGVNGQHQEAQLLDELDGHRARVRRDHLRLRHARERDLS